MAPARWTRVKGKPAKTHDGHAAALRIDAGDITTWTLSRSQIARLLAGAPNERSNAAKSKPLVISLPTPNGTFQRFELSSSTVMAAGLVAKHKDIATFAAGASTTRQRRSTPTSRRLRLPRLGALVRRRWYIDPYYHLDQSLYAAYFGRDLRNGHDAVRRARRRISAELGDRPGLLPRRRRRDADRPGFGPDTAVTITISDPEGTFADRAVQRDADGNGASTADLRRRPDGNLDTHIVEATDGDDSPRPATRSCATTTRRSTRPRATSSASTASRSSPTRATRRTTAARPT